MSEKFIYTNHDRKYAEERNKLIPFAVAAARAATNNMKTNDLEVRKNAWNKAFHKSMNKLWVERP